MSFQGKSVLVTGGGSGIGRAITLKFLAAGANVAIAQRSPPELENSIHIPTDLSEPNLCEKAVIDCIEAMGSLDILINNAGMMQQATVERMTLEDWNRTLQVNLTAPFLLIKHSLDALRQARGAIVNVGSIEGLGSNPGHAAYCASKSGLHALTRAVAVDHGHEGIRCNAVAPGWIDTELNEEFIESMPNPASFRKKIAAIHPAGRTGTPQEVANLVCWLASEEAGFITGQVFTIDGGRMAKLPLPG